MTLTSLLTMIVVGIINGNVISSSMVGVDLAGNNLNSIRNSLVLSLFIFGISLTTGIIIFVSNLVLASIVGEGFIIFVSLLVVSVVVQIADYLLEKLFPIVHAKLDGFIVTLIPAITTILFSLFATGLTFFDLVLQIIFTNIGIALVLTMIAGVRQNKLTYSSYDVFKGNLMTLSILFVLAIVWAAL